MVSSRTLNSNDGGASEIWQYEYPMPPPGPWPTLSTTVTDPAANQAVHTFTDLDSGHLSYYETNATYYSGSSSSGIPLKSVTTAYQYATPLDSGACGYYEVSCSSQLAGYALNVFPTSVTTELMDTGQTSSVAYTYDSGVTFYQPVYGSKNGTGSGYPAPYTGSSSWTGSFGKQTSINQYTYGGSLLATTSTSYEFQTNANYLNANLLNLPSSVSITGSANSIATFGYDENNGSPQCVCGNPTSIHTWLNDSTSATADCPVPVTNGYITTFNVYNTDGTLAKSVDSCGSGPSDTNHMTTFGYNPPPISSPACTNTNPSASPTTVTNALGQTSYTCYDANTGLPTLTQDIKSQQTITAYDFMSRPSSITYPDGGVTAFCYGDEPASLGGACPQAAPPYNVTVTDKITGSINKTETAVIDGLGRVKQKIVAVPASTCSGGFAYTDTFYDVMGRAASVSNPDCTATTSDDNKSTTLYDALGRTCLFIPQDYSGTQPTVCPGSAPANTIFTSYSGNTTTVTDEAGKTRKSATNAAGWLTDVWEAPTNPNLNYHTSYSYDALGDLLSVTQGSQSRTFAYDSMKHLVQSTNPEAGTVCYGTLSGSACQDNGYDANGNLVSKTDARGIKITYAYDYLNRMTGRTYSNGDPSVTYTYGTAVGSGCPGGLGSYNIGRRIGMTDAGGSESFAYDSMGRECTEQRTTNSISMSASYAYNYDGSLKTLTYPSGRVITYTPNIAGQPISAVDSADGINYAGNATYAPQGALGALTQGFLVSSFLYNTRLQPCRMATAAGGSLPTSCTDSSNIGNILDLAYNFGAGTANNGDVYSITNNRDDNRSQTFGYDDLNRLITGYTTGTHATDSSMCWGETFFYDNATAANTGEYGNLTGVGVYSTNYNGCTQDSLNITANLSNNQISSGSGVTYDAGGNVTADGVNTYAWNAESEQKTANSTNYVYDGDGNRLYKATGTTPTKIYWYGAGTEILDESDGSGNITNEYVFFGGKRIAMDTVTGTGGGSISTTYYYAEDLLGSSRTMVQAGATSPCFDADFLPFGREKDAIDTCNVNDYKFEGKERDSETGNDDFGARYYSSNFGRWLSPDWSAIPEPVPYANLTNPQTLNLYAMVQDNPESFADLDGHVNTPASANQWITCNVTDDQGCTEAQMGLLSATERDPDYASYTPEQLAGRLNLLDLPGDPYALTFTPTVKVASCLKDVVACQEATEAMPSKLAQAYDSMLIAADEMRQAEEGWFGKHPNLERGIIIAGFLGGAGEAEEGAVGEGSVAQPNPNGQFVVAPNGTAIRIPPGYEAEPAANGNGLVYRPKGSTGDANTIRIMGPDSQGRYPNGYVRVYNRDGQPIDPLTGRQGNSPATQHTSF